jgi:hypothetical protein
MNIFYIDKDPVVCAEQMVDKHVVKMILETAQLLSTAHRILDGKEYIEKKYVNGSMPARYRNVKRWELPDIRDHVLYQATHMNHPSAVWCRQSNNNYNWLYAHFIALLNEYTYRYGKIHKCVNMCGPLAAAPNNIPISHLTPVTPAMAEQYIISDDSVTNYRNYYKTGKIHLHKWTNRQPPEWLVA